MERPNRTTSGLGMLMAFCIGCPSPQPERGASPAPPTSAAPPAADAENAAGDVAQAWLVLVDGGRYDDSWDAAAGVFRKAVERGTWKQQMDALRAPLGSLHSRRLKSAQYRTSLPGAPDGEYVVIQYESSFSGKATAVETVTPMKDTDGRWHVSGYYIR